MGTRRPRIQDMLGHMAKGRVKLKATCQDCGREKLIECGPLAKRYGFETVYGQIANRFRCSVCRGGRIAVEKVYPGPGSALWPDGFPR